MQEKGGKWWFQVRGNFIVFDFLSDKYSENTCHLKHTQAISFYGLILSKYYILYHRFLCKSKYTFFCKDVFIHR